MFRTAARILSTPARVNVKMANRYPKTYIVTTVISWASATYLYRTALKLASDLNVVSLADLDQDSLADLDEDSDSHDAHKRLQRDIEDFQDRLSNFFK